MDKVKMTIKISGEDVEIFVNVNENGNLVLDGIDNVTYEMYDNELILIRA